MGIDKEHIHKQLKEYGIVPENITTFSYDEKSKTIHVGLSHFSYLRALSQLETLNVRFRSVGPKGFKDGVQISENILIFDDEKKKFRYVNVY